MSSVEDLRSRAMELSRAERAVLARELLLSLETEEPQEDAEAVWAEEIEARSEAVARGELALSDWRESMDRLRDGLRRKETP